MSNGKCTFGLNIPKRMGCREFDPGIGKFCSNPGDFVSPNQIIQMATFFGIKGTELKKVKLIAAREGNSRTEVPAPQPDALTINEPQEEERPDYFSTSATRKSDF